MNAIRLYCRYIGISIRSQMQYRASFAMLAVGHFLATGIEIIGIWALFARFKSLGGWSLPEVGLFYGLVSVEFALAEGIGRGFDVFPGLVKYGNFDRILLRPRSTALQVAAAELRLMRIGRLAQGLMVLGWAVAALHVHWTAMRIALMLLTIIGGAALFYGLFVLHATLAFWTTETLELFNTVTYGGTETGQYPLTIYRPWFRKFFTFVVPLACVTYFPALALLGRDDAVLGSPVWLRWIAPLAGILFMIAALQAWKVGVRHYRSTGS